MGDVSLVSMAPGLARKAPAFTGGFPLRQNRMISSVEAGMRIVILARLRKPESAGFDQRAYTMLSKNSMVLLSSVRVTTAFFQLLV